MNGITDWCGKQILKVSAKKKASSLIIIEVGCSESNTKLLTRALAIIHKSILDHNVH